MYQLSVVFESYITAVGMMRHKKLLPWILLALVLNALFFIVMLIFTWQSAQHVFDIVLRYLAEKTDFEIFKNMSKILTIVMSILGILVYAFIYKKLVLVLFSPLWALIAEKTEEVMRGEDFPFHIHKFLKDVLRSIVVNVYTTFLQFAITVLIFFLSFIPLVVVITSALHIIVNAYFWGYNLIDYRNELYGYNLRSSNKIVSEHAMFSTGVGFVFTLLLYIPIIGVILAPAWSVMAATIGMHRILKYKTA